MKTEATNKKIFPRPIRPQ